MEPNELPETFGDQDDQGLELAFEELLAHARSSACFAEAQAWINLGIANLKFAEDIAAMRLDMRNDAIDD